MLTLYTAVGTLKFQKTTGGKSIPLVINDGQEYGLSDDELLLWSCLAFQILTLHELQDAYTLRQIQKEGPKGLSFQHYLNRLSLRGLVVSGIGLTGVDALYRLLGSLTIIPLKDTFPIRLFGCVQLYLEGTIGAKEFGRYLKKKPSSPMEDTILKLADKVSLTTAELVTSMEQEKVIHNESDIMDELYTEPETTYQTLVDDVQIHHTQYLLQLISSFLRSFRPLISSIGGFGYILGEQPNTCHFHSAGDTPLNAVIVDLTGRNAPFLTCLFECHVVHIRTSDNIFHYISFARRTQDRKYVGSVKNKQRPRVAASACKNY